MIHLDTHVVVWLFAGEHDRIPRALRDRMEAEPLAVSPIVRVELAFLREIERLTATPPEILDELHRSIGLATDATLFADVAAAASDQRMGFTRDPFDRMIAAQAATAGAALATKDQAMRAHLTFTVWD